MNIKAYYFRNDQWPNCRGFQGGWYRLHKELGDYLSKKYNAEVYYESNINFWEDKKTSYRVEKLDHEVSDTTFLIHNEDNDSLIGISSAEHDLFGVFNLFKKRNNPKDSVFISQSHNWSLRNPDGTQIMQDHKSDYNFKISSTPYYGCNEDFDLDVYFQKRKNIQFKDLKNSFFIKSTHSSRPDLLELNKLGYCCDPLPVGHDQYFDLAVQHKLGLCISACAEYSERDIEYLGMGLPYITLEYMHNLEPALEPNKHYISISREKGAAFDEAVRSDCQGGQKYVEAYIKRFKEVENDEEFLNYISHNAKEYYDKYCSPKNKLSHFLSLLNLEEFLRN